MSKTYCKKGELPPQATTLHPTKGAQLKSNSTFDYDNKDLHLHTRHSSSIALSLISQHKHTSHLLQKTSKTTWYFWHLNLESQEDMEISKDASISLENLQSPPPPAVWLICNKCLFVCECLKIPPPVLEDIRTGNKSDDHGSDKSEQCFVICEYFLVARPGFWPLWPDLFGQQPVQCSLGRPWGPWLSLSWPLGTPARSFHWRWGRTLLRNTIRLRSEPGTKRLLLFDLNHFLPLMSNPLR